MVAGIHTGIATQFVDVLMILLLMLVVLVIAVLSAIQRMPVH